MYGSLHIKSIIFSYRHFFRNKIYFSACEIRGELVICFRKDEEKLGIFITDNEGSEIDLNIVPK